ncbi:hypothetical protein [Cyanobacterium sp. Dongsha4]|uniref:hypothetical protein n=1 Tax=Cyanobacterium sp. DS4 TaxID=2878255 RepID=UPI002E812C6C|nr:hypothetical protein [Cyanobacterium sp. Dongsha4]WVL00414.1 hypothetical protein Dongsha4_17480 [Cyanobacterium sp. Dongsha4]
MKLILKSSCTISNRGSHSDYDDLMIRSMETNIFLDISDTLSDDEYYGREDEGILEIGKIISNRVDLRYFQTDLWELADDKNPDLEELIAYFFYDEGQKFLEDIFADSIYYIDQVVIKPKYRGYDYGLYALALLLESILLESITNVQVVACHPHPININNIKPVGRCIEEEDRPKIKKAQQLLKRYWSKLGLNNYSEKHNILWGVNWVMPKWIREKLFPSILESQQKEDLIPNILQMDEDNFLKDEDNLIMTQDNICKDFNDFLDCCKEYKIDYEWNNFDSFIMLYYQTNDETLTWIEKLDKNDKNELKKLINKNGESMFDEQKFDILLLAKDFAISDDPNKRLNYCCTVQYEFDARFDSYPSLKVNININVNAISNKYLKLPEDDQLESYQSYLFDLANDEIDNNYAFYNINQYSGSTSIDYKLID